MTSCFKQFFSPRKNTPQQYRYDSGIADVGKEICPTATKSNVADAQGWNKINTNLNKQSSGHTPDQIPSVPRTSGFIDLRKYIIDVNKAKLHDNYRFNPVTRTIDFLDLNRYLIDEKKAVRYGDPNARATSWSWLFDTMKHVPRALHRSMQHDEANIQKLAMSTTNILDDLHDRMRRSGHVKTNSGLQADCYTAKCAKVAK